MKTILSSCFALLSAVSSATVAFDGDFLGDRAVKFVAGDAVKMLSGMEGRIVLKKDVSLKERQWHLKSDGTTLTVSGRDEMAVIYGIYTFLEKHMGFRWYAPDVTKKPDVKGRSFPVVDETASCAYFFFDMGVGPEEPADKVWLLRNKQSRDAAFSVGVAQGSPCGVHTFPKYVDEIRKTHPELFGVKPSAAKGKACQTLCLTDPKVRELVAEQMIKYIEKDRARKSRPTYATSVIYDLAQADGASGEQCMCETCASMAEREGSYAGPNIDFCNEVTRRVNAKYPEIKVRTLAYSYVADPPKTVVADENVIVRFCRAWIFDPLVKGSPQARDLENWAKHAKTLGIWSYWRTFQGPLYPFVKKRADIEAEIRFCHENGARHYYGEDEEPILRSFSMLQHWLLLKMCENPYQSIKPLADEFMSAYYGAAAKPMTEYLDYLERREEVTQAYLDREFFEKVNAWLDEAERLAAGDKIALRHIHWERTIVDRSMYEKLHGLLKAGYEYDKELVAARFERNAAEIVKFWPGWGNSEKDKAVRNERLAAVKQEAALYARYPMPVPEMFDGLDVVSMEWNQIPLVLGKYKYVEDPLAAAGTAFTITDKEMKLPYEFGMYHDQRKEGDSISLYQEDIPQDGKYHCYRIGTAVIQRPLYVFFNRAWNPRTYLRTLGIIPETRDVWVSARFQGPVFVDGSTEPDGVFIDRLFLVKGAVLDLYEKPSPDNAALMKASSGAVDAKKGHWRSEPIGDPEKLIGDVYVRGRVSYSGVTIDAFPFGGLGCVDAKGKTVFAIPIATFYPGNDDGRNFETVIDASRIRNRMRRKAGSFTPPCSLSFAVHVPSQSAASVKVENVTISFVNKKKGSDTP